MKSAAPSWEAAAAAGLPLELRTYRISCDPAAFARIKERYWEDTYIPCILTAQGEVFGDARIRLRGETSREYPKKSFKINLSSAHRLEGRDKLNLISEWTDPTYCREFLSYDLFRRAGLPSSRAWFARLYVNEEYQGLYLDVEQIDEHWLDINGLDSDAAIFKAAANGCLLALGESDEGRWERETGDSGDFSTLDELAGWIAAVYPEDFLVGLRRRFDAEALARAIAVNSLIGNSSTYYHNYYLMRTPGEAGRWFYLPWDMDKTWIYGPGYYDPPYCRSGHQTIGVNELIRRCWLNVWMRERIRAHIAGISDSLFRSSCYRPRCDSLLDLLYDAAASDPAKQYTISDFYAILDDLPYRVEGRRERLASQLREPPLPFDLNPPLASRGQMIFSWSDAGTTDHSVSYYLWIDRSILFNREPDVFEVGASRLQSIAFDEPGEYYWRVYARATNGAEMVSLSQFQLFMAPEYRPSIDTIRSGFIGELMLSAEGGPFYIPGDIVIPEGSSLAIESGAIIETAALTMFNVRGELRLMGTAEDSIRFDPGSAVGIVLQSPEAKLEAEWTVFHPTGEYGDITAGTIRIEEGGSALLKHCTIPAPNREGGSGIALYGGMLQMEECMLYGRNGRQLCSANPAAGDAVFAELKNCVFRNPLDDDIRILYPTIDFSGSGGTLKVEGCRFYGGGESIVAYQPTLMVNRCRFEDDQGILMGDPRGWRIANSIFIHSGGVSAGSDGVIVNCDFVLSPAALRQRSGRVTVRNCIFWRCESPFNWSSGGVYNVEYCTVDPGVFPPGPGNRGSGPRFVNPWIGDFNLQDDSPLVDAGDGEWAPERDYYGKPRVNIPDINNGGAGRPKWTDIGAIERQEGGAPEPVDIGLETLESYPNPANGAVAIIFRVETEGAVNLKISDIHGRRVFERDYQYLIAGEYRVYWDAGGVASGLYFCWLKQAGELKVWKLTALH